MSASNDNSDDSSSTNDEIFSSLAVVEEGEKDFEKIPKSDEIRQFNKKCCENNWTFFQMWFKAVFFNRWTIELF